MAPEAIYSNSPIAKYSGESSLDQRYQNTLKVAESSYKPVAYNSIET